MRALWTTALSLGLLLSSGAPAREPAPVRLGVLAVGEAQNELPAWQSLREHLSQSLSAPVELKIGPRELLDRALDTHQLDLVITHPGHAIELLQARQVSSPIATRLLRTRAGDTSEDLLGAFGGVIFARNAPGAPTRLEDIARVIVATPDVHWLGAYQMQALELKERGISLPSDARLLQVGANQGHVVEAVLAGRAAIGFVRTGLLEEMAQEGRLDLNQIRILNEQNWPRFPFKVSTRLYPEWPVLLAPHVEAATARRIGAALLSMPAQALPPIGGFTIPADYREVVAVLKANRAPPFDRFQSGLWQEFWNQHRWALTTGLVALGLLALAGLALAWEHRRLRRSFQRVAMLADASRDAIFSLDAQGRTKLWGQVADRLFGPRLARGQDFCGAVLAPATLESAHRLLNAALLSAEAGREFKREVQALDAAQQTFPAELTFKVVQPNAHHKQTAVLAFVQDLRAERAHVMRTRLMSSVFTHTNEGITITDPQGHILEVNAAFSAITGYAREEVLGLNPRILQSGRQTPEFYRAMWTALQQEGHWSGEIWNRRKSGEVYPEILSISAVRDLDGALQHYVAVFTDITGLKRQQQELERVAHFDALTGLPNRTLLADRFAQAAAHAHRHKRCIAAVHLDIDQFSQINERLGQAAADDVLCMLAQRLHHTLREDDTVARTGGDEFIVLLTDMDSAESTREVVLRLQQLIAEPFQLYPHTVNLSTSLGVAVYPDDSEQTEKVLRGAEQASYRAKQSGRNAVCYFDAEHENAIRQRNEKVAQLRTALQAGQFVLHYQPKVNMRTRKVIGAEALIRWQHPERGLVPPGEFLTLIEKDPFELEVGEWVLQTALQQLAHWQAQGLHLPVSVNISGEHLQAPDFRPRLAALLARHPQVAPTSLELEILESSALEDMDCVQSVLSHTQALGVHSALDDFGTGYSSLAYLKHLPVSTLKIDQSFVRGMTSSDGDRAIVQAVIELGRAFGRDVIAEGVENEELAQALLKLGCEHGQGYSFAKAMPGEQLPAWVRFFEATPVIEGSHTSVMEPTRP
ncbi:EAL domain-containing protein [Inhella gelatinilytica]|uniref:EAL domain-containing protein n=1 Tax=Inhella gelatinilytica TaxID=2795030 RepID=A0A931J1N9_9BURK|nr:EAL domain-containing protein [Inhella gelatinilytica]MBH9553726.1 EAL domain-containing protein [Inhella gelatinilytica]